MGETGGYFLAYLGEHMETGGLFQLKQGLGGVTFTTNEFYRGEYQTRGKLWGGIYN